MGGAETRGAGFYQKNAEKMKKNTCNHISDMIQLLSKNARDWIQRTCRASDIGRCRRGKDGSGGFN